VGDDAERAPQRRSAAPEPPRPHGEHRAEHDRQQCQVAVLGQPRPQLRPRVGAAEVGAELVDEAHVAPTLSGCRSITSSTWREVTTPTTAPASATTTPRLAGEDNAASSAPRNEVPLRYSEPPATRSASVSAPSTVDPGASQPRGRWSSSTARRHRSEVPGEDPIATVAVSSGSRPSADRNVSPR